MTEESLKYVPDVFSNLNCTLMRTSKDDTNDQYMTESKLKVINFDRVPKLYAKGKNWRGVPKSNDALYIDSNGHWYWIEFKNGSIKKEELYRKIYDSIIMSLDLGAIPDLEFTRQNCEYILVYNDEKYTSIKPSESRTGIGSYVMGLAKTEKKLFGVQDFEQYLLKETHTYTPGEFEQKFVQPMEKQEQMYTS